MEKKRSWRLEQMSSSEQEKYAEKALKEYQKGEKHLASGKYKKCESEFGKAIDYFMLAGEIDRAEKVNLKLCECFIIEKKYYEAGGAASSAAELILRHKKYKNAIKHYQSVIDFYEKVDAIIEIHEIYCLMILCNLAQGKFQDAITLLKKKIAKSTLPQIKKNKIIQLTTLIINTILQKSEENLEEINYQLSKLKLEKGISTLFETVQRLIGYYVETFITISPDQEEIRAGDEVEIKIEVKRPQDLQIIESDLVFDRIFDLIEDKKLTDDKSTIMFKVRPRIQGNLKIGPISLICEIDEFQFPIRIQRTLEIHPGKPNLILQPEVGEINTTVGTPVEFNLNLKNLGKGECMNLSLQLTLPEELELVEGSLEKKLHALGPQEEFLFTFRIIANEKVNTSLNANLTFKDLEEELYSIEMDPIPFNADG